MDDFDVWYIVPLSTVGIIIFGVVVCVFGGSYAVWGWFREHFGVILGILAALILAVSVLLAIAFKNPLLFLGPPIASSQLFFFLPYGFGGIQDVTGFGLIWETIKFILWLVYGIINAGFCIICPLFFSLDEGFAKTYKTEAYQRLNPIAKLDKGGFGAALVSGLICGIGWIINFVLFVIF